MLRIAQHQLQCVLAGRQFDTGLGLARAEMNMVLVLWNRLVRIQRFVHIDQQMMMTAVLKIVAGVGDAHSAQTETRLELPPGKHTLQLVLGDAKHYPFSPPLVSEKITVTVK